MYSMSKFLTLVGRVRSVESWDKKLALNQKLRNLHVKSQIKSIDCAIDTIDGFEI